MRIGVVGSGLIVGTLLETLEETPGVVCSALCVRPESKAKGEALANRYRIPTLYTDYKQLLAQRDSDFIYIGIVNNQHYAYAEQALRHGRNVIVEKPFTTTPEQAGKLAGLAREKGLYLFEAITNQYAPNFLRMKEWLGRIGQVKLVQCNYSQRSSRLDAYLRGEVHPAFDPRAFGGALTDINIYNLHLVIGLFGMPDQADYFANRGHNGVDTSGLLLLQYPQFLAQCTAAKDSDSPCFAIVQGTEGYLALKGQPNRCDELEVCIGGRTERYYDPKAPIRMIWEMLAFETIWRQGNYDRCLAMLEHTCQVMEVLQLSQPMQPE